MADSLQDELLAIPGIAGAEFEGSEEHPVGVRVQLASGADPDQVGQAVQRLLAAHGMRSQMAHEEAPSILPAGSVVNLSDYETAPDEAPADGGEAAADEWAETVDERDAGVEVDAVEADLEVMSGPPPQVEVPAVDVDAVAEVSGDETEAVDVVPTAAPLPVPEPAAEEPVPAPPAAAAVVAAIAGVAVDEDGTRIQVTVRSTDGSVAARSVPATPNGLDEAAAAAAAELAAPDTMPRVVAIVDETIEGSAVVTVMLEGAGGRRLAGSSIVHGSRAYAVARATWAALRA